MEKTKHDDFDRFCFHHLADVAVITFQLRFHFLLSFLQAVTTAVEHELDPTGIFDAEPGRKFRSCVLPADPD